MAPCASSVFLRESRLCGLFRSNPVYVLYMYMFHGSRARIVAPRAALYRHINYTHDESLELSRLIHSSGRTRINTGNRGAPLACMFWYR